MNKTLIIAVAVGLTACDRGAAPAPPAQEPDAVAAAPAADWPESGPVNVLLERSRDLTGDGREERIVVTAVGARYDSLDIVLRIEDDRRRLLWTEAWNSRFYFEYDPLDGKSDQEVAGIVQQHVAALVDDARFHERGMPPGMISGDPGEMIHESVRYHLAELDWRRGASLEPADPTPADAYRRIRPETVVSERVDVIVAEVSRRPTYSYYAGGEASYVLGWSDREQSFIRLFACC